jgi:hypothetical protein
VSSRAVGWCGQANAWQLQFQEDHDNRGDGSELVEVDLNNGKREGANSKINALGDEQSTVMAFSNDHSGVFEQINEDTKFEVEAGPKDLNCGTSLHADTKSSLDSCLAYNDSDWQLIQVAPRAVTS